jgi:hypothetical protein
MRFWLIWTMLAYWPACLLADDPAPLKSKAGRDALSVYEGKRKTLDRKRQDAFERIDRIHNLEHAKLLAELLIALKNARKDEVANDDVDAALQLSQKLKEIESQITDNKKGSVGDAGVAKLQAEVDRLQAALKSKRGKLQADVDEEGRAKLAEFLNGTRWEWHGTRDFYNFGNRVSWYSSSTDKSRWQAVSTNTVHGVNSDGVKFMLTFDEQRKFFVYVNSIGDYRCGKFIDRIARPR